MWLQRYFKSLFGLPTFLKVDDGNLTKNWHKDDLPSEKG